MTNSQSTQLDPSSLPDLPGLEEIKPQFGERIIPAIGFVCLILVQVVLIAWLYLQYHTYLDGDLRIKVTSMVAIIMLCVIWLVGRILFSYSAYGTSREGLVAYAPLRKQVISWENILDVSREDDAFWGDRITITTPTGSFRFRTGGIGTKLHVSLLIASIWQYMRKRGRLSNDILEHEELSLWHPIPDTVPHIVEARYKGAFATHIIALLFLAMMLYLTIGSTTDGHPIGGYILLLCMLSLMLPLYFLLGIHKPRRLSVSDSEIIAETVFQKLSISWNEVAAYGANKEQLWIIAKNPNRTIWIPLISNTPEANDLRLAVVRNLRSAWAVPHLNAFDKSTADWKKLQQKKSSSQTIVRAYIASQPVEIASKLRMAYQRLSFIILLPVTLALFSMFLDPIGRINALIRATPDTLFQYSASTPLSAIFILLPIGLFIQVIIRFINNRTVASCSEQWNQLMQLGGVQFSASLRFVVMILTIISMLGLIAASDDYYRITTSSIYENLLFSFQEQVYPYNQISQIKQTSFTDKNNKTDYWNYTIRLQNGKQFRLSEQMMLENDKQKLTSTFQYISQKTKVPITYSE